MWKNLSSYFTEDIFIIDLKNARKDAINIVGSKGVSLGELISIGIKVPPGFVITSHAYNYFISYNKLDEKISKIFRFEKDIEIISRKIKKLILDGEIPQDLRNKIFLAYESLAKVIGNNGLVAVRSSVPPEDTLLIGTAEQYETYLNVTKDELLDAIKKVWASLYTPIAILDRRFKGLDQLKAKMAVIVQEMINSKTAGVMFTLHPITGDRNYIMIDSSWGLGEAVTSGKVTPDEILIEKSSLKIVQKKISHKRLKIIYDKEKRKNVIINLSEEADKISITDEEAIELAKLALKIEKYYGISMDIEWAIDSNLQFPDNIFIVQARPEIYWTDKQEEKK